MVQPAAEKKHTFIRPNSVSSSSTPEEMDVEQTTSSPATVVQQNDSPRSFTETSIAYGVIHRSMESHNLFQAFISNCFPTNLSPTSHSWIPLLGKIPSRVEALETSTAAIAASAIGHMFQDTALIKQSLNYYTRGLNQLQRALRDPNLMREDGTLAACMALSLYEALECPNLGSEGYFNHCHGLIALIKARGHEAHSSGVGHRLFLGVRVPGILSALYCRTSSMFLEPSWMEIPWEGMQKTPRDRVTDCLAQAPAILEQVGSLIHMSPAQQSSLLQKLISECSHIDEQIDNIYEDMQLSAASALYWPVELQLDSVTGLQGATTLFPVVLCFQNIQIATTLVLLWATRTMLWAGLTNMYQHLEVITPCESFSPSPSLELLSGSNPAVRCKDYILMAHQVCQSVEYFLNDEMMLSGALSVSPALGIVADSLCNRPGHAEEIAWIQRAMGLARRKGMGVLEHVKL
ncbi:hypothetical protein N7452_006991 [Penicillium brevicompactum]|uniref:Uncharacterized protein n=1 Tax=Penicillium brevicompactum TaxID=5074 RepID=A0A9W9UFB7_PENBR|nr:hypothetical protein N7452_006991 [Penicillium brevicompactum]